MPAASAALDRRALRRAFEHASSSYDRHAVVQARAREQMLERLALLGFEPAVIVDLGAGTGHGARALSLRFPRARVVALDLAPAMLVAARAQRGWRRRFARICADAEALPLRSGSVDLVFSNLLLPWAQDLGRLLGEVRRVLGPRGYFTFTTFGPDTLMELRAAWAEVDGLPHVHPFLDMHDVGDLLLRAGFADPVMDVDRVGLSYATAHALCRDLKAVGAQNVLAGRAAGLTGRGRLAALEAAYGRLRDPSGRLPASCELVFGQAWCPGASPPQSAARGETLVPLASVKRR